MAESAGPAPNAGGLRRQILIAETKVGLIEGRAALRRRFAGRGRVGDMLRGHSRLVDSALARIWSRLAMPETLALAAVGGYGRGKLFPQSDVDILVLLPGPEDEALKADLERFMHTLWDAGIEVGPSVRTIGECLTESAKDLTVQTTLLEARQLAGDPALFRRFSEAMAGAMDAPGFCEAKQLEQQQRHLKFHDTSYNLEPNLKESPGGLRDLQNILWISHAAGLGDDWRALAQADLITRDEARQIARHEAFLEGLRIRVHYLAGRREDRLLFDLQGQLAAQFGIPGTASRRASELLMQRYYRAAMSVAQLNTILLQNLRTRIIPGEDHAVHPLNARFQARGNLLEARNESVFEKTPSAILDSFLLLQQHPELTGMTAPTLRALWRAAPRIDAAFRRSPANRARFMELLRQPQGITHEFRRMNRYGILGRYIPAFGRVVGQMQHDLFHVYTVDEHILMVVRNLRRFTMPEFSHEYPLCSRLIAEFERPELLYLAGLFHDIAKGRGGDHSELGARDALRFCKSHGLPKEDAELVSWLVRHHLTMSATAQKKDLSDPQVLEEFAALVGTDRSLVALYLLTVCDIRGTSPKVWNGWKAKLLEDLFWATRRRLAGAAGSIADALEERKAKALGLLQLYAIPEHAHERLWSRLDTVYFMRHDAQEIAWHTRLLNYRVDTKDPVVKARLAPIGEGIQVLVYCSDQPELFARICGFFERTGYSIVEAKVHTTKHGYALDSFLVLDTQDRSEHLREMISLIEYELQQRLATQAPLGPPVQGRLSRQMRHVPMEPQVQIRPGERASQHTMSIIAGDRPGLLYRVARALAQYGVNVHSARINTLGERAEDTFLISGPALEDPNAVVRLESNLLQDLR